MLPRSVSSVAPQTRQRRAAAARSCAYMIAMSPSSAIGPQPPRALALNRILDTSLAAECLPSLLRSLVQHRQVPLADVRVIVVDAQLVERDTITPAASRVSEPAVHEEPTAAALHEVVAVFA